MRCPVYEHKTDHWILIYDDGKIGSPFYSEHEATERARALIAVDGGQIQVAHIIKVVNTVEPTRVKA